MVSVVLGMLFCLGLALAVMALVAVPARRAGRDVLSERGYRACATVEMREVPSRVDPVSHAIICTKKPRYKFEMKFEGSRIRRGW